MISSILMGSYRISSTSLEELKKEGAADLASFLVSKNSGELGSFAHVQGYNFSEGRAVDNTDLFSLEEKIERTLPEIFTVLSDYSLLGNETVIRDNMAGIAVVDERAEGKAQKNITSLFCQYITGAEDSQKEAFTEGVMKKYDAVTKKHEDKLNTLTEKENLFFAFCNILLYIINIITSLFTCRSVKDGAEDIRANDQEVIQKRASFRQAFQKATMDYIGFRSRSLRFNNLQTEAMGRAPLLV